MPKQISEQGLTFIRQQEAFRGKIYKDVAGNLTIGYGHLVLPNELAKYNTAVLTEREAEELLHNDINPVVDYLNNVCMHYGINLEQYQFDMLCSLVFNAGGIERKPSMLNAFEHKDIKGIGNSITLYNAANHVVLEGLIKRRAEEQAIYFDGY